MTQKAEERARNVIDIIREDHREVEQLFQQGHQTADPDEFSRVVNRVIAELIRHSVAEEEYLYPAMREHLDGGDELADHEIAEHAQAEQIMKDIERLDASDPQLREQFYRLEGEIAHHVEEEENDALPRLQAACPEDKLRELGTKIERAKSVAPTRPHPSAPDTPPMNKLLAPGAGLVDRIRDALTGGATSAR